MFLEQLIRENQGSESFTAARAKLLGCAIIYFYIDQESWPAPIFGDHLLYHPMPNPVPFDTHGYIPPIFMDFDSTPKYRIEIKNYKGKTLAILTGVSKGFMLQQTQENEFYTSVE